MKEINMNKKIHWSKQVQLDISIIKELEDKWEVRFPKEYVDIVLNHDGSKPNVIDQQGEWISGVVEVPEKFKWGFQLLSFIEKEVLGRILSPIERSFDTVSDALPKKVYPFAINGSGDRFLFDFREDENSPKIVFQNHEDIILESELDDEELDEKSLEEWQDGTLFSVSPSFEEFLNSIQPSEID